MNTVDIPFLDWFNSTIGLIVAILSFFLGTNWFLFVGFLLLNVGDFITGCIKSYLTKKDNSAKGLKGIIKKLSYWIMILLAFGMSELFIQIGYTIGVNLGVSQLIGWFVLASLIINEIRSIFENLVESGVELPEILIKGLQVAEKAIDAADGIFELDSDEKPQIHMDIPMDEVLNKDEIRLKIKKKMDK